MVNFENNISKVELDLPTERERKFLCHGRFNQLAWFIHHNAFWKLKGRIEQVYLSHPDEDWSLRVRRTVSKSSELESSEPEYTATLKSCTDTQAEETLERVEIETPISEEMFAFFRQQEQLPRLTKNRHFPMIDHDYTLTSYWGITVDSISGIDMPIIEIEDPEKYDWFIEKCREEEHIEEVTQDTAWQNEHIAHELFKAKNGSEALVPKDPLNAAEICHDIVRYRIDKNTTHPTIIGLRGRSGSGKTTFAHELQQTLADHGMSSTIIATDDYNRGVTAMNQLLGHEEWRSNWDEHMIYDTALLAQELEAYAAHGEPIPQRSFDFMAEEPELIGEYHPESQIIIVEGIFAHSDNIAPLLNLKYEMPTPLATCIGRRLVRDLSTRENNKFQDPAELLRYQLEVAEPMYQKYSS